MIRKLFQKRYIKKVFSEYISPEQIDKLLKGEIENDIGELKSSDLEVIIVMVNGDSPQSISQKMGRVADVGSDYGGITDTLISSIVIILYGTDLLGGSNKHVPNVLIEKLKAEFQEEIKIMIVKGKGYFSNLGGPTRFSYSFILPEFPEAISALNSLPFGSIKNFKDFTEPVA